MQEDPLDQILDEMIRRRVWILDDIRIRATLLRDVCNKLISKLEEDGPDAYYSINHESLDHARRLHKGCMELSLMRGWIDRIRKRTI